MTTMNRNPVVIVPGVLFWDGLYEVMREALTAYLPVDKIEIAPVSFLDWVGFPPSPERSTNRVMAAIDSSVQFLRKKYPKESVTIVAHSGGGTVAMIYLLEKRFQGDEFHPGEAVRKLVTLGTPFHTHEHYAKIKTDFIFRHLDRDFFLRKEVVSIVSDQYHGDLQGSVVEKMCYMFYKSVADEGHVAGDGIVPAESCYLEGARNIRIPHVEHLPTPHTRWYGTKEGVEQWIQWL